MNAQHGSITNTEYQEINGISRQTTTRDLKELVEKFKYFVGKKLSGLKKSQNKKKQEPQSWYC